MSDAPSAPPANPATPVDAAPGGQSLVQTGALEIVDDNGALIPQGKTWIVGQQVKLTVRSKVPNQTLSDIAWVIPADIVGGQTYTNNGGGAVTPVAPADLQNATVQFYWPGVPAANVILVVATVSGQKLGATLVVTVLAPSSVSLTAKTSSVNIGLDSQNTFSLTFHEAATNTVGISFEGKVSPPPGGDGEIAFLQLIAPFRSHGSVSGVSKSIDSLHEFWLDDPSMKLAATDVFLIPPLPAAASTPNTLGGGDSPGNAIAATDNVSVAWDVFKIYLMYRPSTPNAIWVTLARLDWKWGGVAEKGTQWTLTSSDFSPTPVVGVLSTELPVWSDAFRHHSDKEW